MSCLFLALLLNLTTNYFNQKSAIMKNLILSFAFALFGLNDGSTYTVTDETSAHPEMTEDESLCSATANGLFTDLECVSSYTYNLELRGSSCNASYCIQIISGGTLNSSSCQTATNGNVLYPSGWSITATGTEALRIYIDCWGSGMTTQDITVITIPRC